MDIRNDYAIFLFYSQKKDGFNALFVSHSLSEPWSTGGEFMWLIFDPKNHPILILT